MATFSIKIRKRSKKGFHSVYLLCQHRSELRYINTGYSVGDKGVVGSGDVIDPLITASLAPVIVQYYERLSKVDTRSLTLSEVIDIAQGKDKGNLSFTAFARSLIERRQAKGSKVDQQKAAVLSLHQFFGEQELLFADLTTKALRSWIESLAATKTAKAEYPKIVKNIFIEAYKEYNDYDRMMVRLPQRPFDSLEIPKRDAPEKRSVSLETLQRFFAAEPRDKGEQYMQDMLRLSFCLAGINMIDLAKLQQANYRDGYICYERSKTKAKRSDKAYIEVKLPAQAQAAFERLWRKDSEGSLLQSGYNTRAASLPHESLAHRIDYFARKLCEREGLPKITSYTMRHSWATIARNEVGASMEDVAFCLNHSSAHKVTDLYIRKDFSRIDRINAEVLVLVFGQEQEA